MGHRETVHLVQADLYHLPFKKQSFDKVICLGVLQHTPDPKASFDKVIEQLKGQVRLRWRSMFIPNAGIISFGVNIGCAFLLVGLNRPFLLK